MDGAKKSRRGVWYDLTASPYEFRTPYGDVFKFSSQKKLDIYVRDVAKEIDRVDKLFARNGLVKLVPEELVDLIKRLVYKAFYNSNER